MNTSRTLRLPGPPTVTAPRREQGSSALDRRAPGWSPPDPASIAVAPWAPPRLHALVRPVAAPWSAPDPATRDGSIPPPGPMASRELPPPSASTATTTVEPLHPFRAPDLATLRRRALPAPGRVSDNDVESMSNPSSRRSTRCSDDPAATAPAGSVFPSPDPAQLVATSLPTVDTHDEVTTIGRSGVSARVVGAVVVGFGICAAAAAALVALF